MNAHRRLCAFATLSFLLCSQVFAGAPPIADFTCGDIRARVQTRADPRLKYFAVASSVLTGPLAGGYEIRVNPERTYLGKATQEWLYLRQCAHISQRHGVLTGEQNLNPKDEEDADCWAVRELVKKSGGSPRILYSIESDMDRVLSEATRWREVLPGPQRRVLLSSCLRN